jgi:hypothetical protein
MTEELIKIPGILRKLNIENDTKLITLFDGDWGVERLREIEDIDQSLNALVANLNNTILTLNDRPYRHVDKILDSLARIYLDLGKCAKYADALDGLITSVLLRDSQDLVKPDEN